MTSLDKMITVDSVMYDVMASLPDSQLLDEEHLLELCYKGARHFYNHKLYEKKVCCLRVDNFKTCLPKDYSYIESVMYNADYNYRNIGLDSTNTESTTDITRDILNETGEATTTLITSTTKILTTVDIDNEFNYVITSNNGVISKKSVDKIYSSMRMGSSKWKFMTVGRDIQSIVSIQDCGFNHAHTMNTCQHMFNINGAGEIVVTFEAGWIAVCYFTLPRNEKDQLLIPDVPKINDAIKSYVYYIYFSKKYNSGDDGARDKMMYWQGVWQNLYLSVSGDLLRPNVAEWINYIDGLTLFSNDSHYQNYLENPVKERVYL